MMVVRYISLVHKTKVYLLAPRGFDGGQGGSVAVMSPLVALVAFPLPQPLPGPLDRLVGDWTSLEQVETPEGRRTLRLKGTNRWVFEGRLLEIHERYTVDGDLKPGENHILLRALDGGKVAAWWYVPDMPEPLVFEGSSEAGGLTLTRKDGRMRIVYRWDGERAYDAKLQTRGKGDEAWSDRTVARYKKA